MFDYINVLGLHYPGSNYDCKAINNPVKFTGLSHPTNYFDSFEAESTVCVCQTVPLSFRPIEYGLENHFDTHVKKLPDGSFLRTGVAKNDFSIDENEFLEHVVDENGLYYRDPDYLGKLAFLNPKYAKSMASFCDSRDNNGYPF